MNGAFASALKKMKEGIADGKLIKKDEHVLCALSGGADSVALLLLLKELDIKLYAAHLNHGIRAQEADRDEEFCKKLCAELDIPFVSGKANVPLEAAKSGKGLEEAAREIRYNFLSKVAYDFKCTKICTAHHADDNIETVLLHLIRGCGLNGLTGISPMRDNIVRPLLTLRKQELVDAVLEKGYTFVHDSTNDQTYNTRNYIRHNILPHIYSLNESADKAFHRMCVSLETDNKYLEDIANKLPPNMSRTSLAGLDMSILARYVRARYSDVAGKGKAPDAHTVDLIIKSIKSYETVKYDVTGDITVYISASGIEFLPRATDKKMVDAPLRWGENEIKELGYIILITDDESAVASFSQKYQCSVNTEISYDKIKEKGELSLYVRTVRRGDKYVYGKMHRDVRRQLINEKIPLQSRGTLPVIYGENGIVLVHGLRVCDSYAHQKGKKSAYIVISKI